MKRTILGLSLASPLFAHAAIPANVTTALGDALTDASGVAALALIIVVAVAAFKYMRSAVR